MDEKVHQINFRACHRKEYLKTIILPYFILIDSKLKTSESPRMIRQHFALTLSPTGGDVEDEDREGERSNSWHLPGDLEQVT